MLGVKVRWVIYFVEMRRAAKESEAGIAKIVAYCSSGHY